MSGRTFHGQRKDIPQAAVRYSVSNGDTQELKP